MKTEEEFIERVKHLDLIYDKRNFNYNNINERDKIWMKLSNEFKCDAKNKWMRLRDKYVRLKRMSTNADTNFMTSMSFVDKHIKLRKPNAVKDEEFFDEPEIEDVRSFYNEFCVEITTPPNSSENIQSRDILSDNSSDNKPPKPKKQKTDSIQSDFMETLTAFEDKLQQKFQKTDENDEDACFLRLMAAKMKKMSFLDKSIFQLEILKKANEIIINKD